MSGVCEDGRYVALRLQVHIIMAAPTSVPFAPRWLRAHVSVVLPAVQGDLPKCLPLAYHNAYAQCRYHDGYLTIHFESHKYQDIELSPLQHEAVW